MLRGSVRGGDGLSDVEACVKKRGAQLAGLYTNGTSQLRVSGGARHAERRHQS